jgi:RNA 2',3'-cyclic 3'-phosphodiesterase
MKRTFLALPVHTNNCLSDCYNQFKKEIPDDLIKWVPVDHFHITLFFLGSTREEQICHIKEAIRQSMANTPVFEIEIHGCGVFPNILKPRVLWFGIKKNPVLVELKQQIEKSLKVFDFQPEERPYQPHLTFGRVKQIFNPEILTGLLNVYENKSLLRTEVRNLLYFESQLTSSGPVYSILEEFELTLPPSEVSHGKE